MTTTQYTMNIDGELFEIAEIECDEEMCKEMAKNWRDRGYYARVLEDSACPEMWEVWIRHKEHGVKVQDHAHVHYSRGKRRY